MKTLGPFEGACVNCRNPGTRRVWKGDSEPQSHPAFSDENEAAMKIAKRPRIPGG